MGRIIFLFLLAGLCLTSCDKNRVFDQYKSLPGHWNRDSVLVFTVKKLDTVHPYNVFINIRNTNAYPFSNIYLITSMKFPQGKIIKDTLQYKMAYPNGKWMGVGMGEAKLSKLWYRQAMHFPEKGAYTFKIRQAMRKRGEKDGIKSLKGITEVGLRIETLQQTQTNEN